MDSSSTGSSDIKIKGSILKKNLKLTRTMTMPLKEGISSLLNFSQPTSCKEKREAKLGPKLLKRGFSDLSMDCLPKLTLGQNSTSAKLVDHLMHSLRPTMQKSSQIFGT